MRGLDAEEHALLSDIVSAAAPARAPTPDERQVFDRLRVRTLVTTSSERWWCSGCIYHPSGGRHAKAVPTPLGREALRIASALRALEVV